ncbi:hypothetical protein NVP1101O_189 [Vibrio phage 1.101.O._10N.261.45.C6]|nr:hypothetical protein NVP1101O_189 [Vibrio phage 1.101.O._10N.261.45.C6]
MIKILLSQNTNQLKDYFSKTKGTCKYWLPETEKHPEEVIKWVDRNLREVYYYDTIVIATHSKTLVDYLGDLIEFRELSQYEVFLEVVKDKTVKQSWFDKQGDLINWEIGFFSGR